MPRRRSHERLLRSVIQDRAVSAVQAWCLKNNSRKGAARLKACCLRAVEAAVMETEITDPAIAVDLSRGLLTIVVTGTVSLEQVRVELEVSDNR